MEHAMLVANFDTLTLLPQEVQHLSDKSTADIFKPNTEDLWNLDTIGIKEPKKLEDDDSIGQAIKDCQKEGEVWGNLAMNRRRQDDNCDLSVERLKSSLKRIEGNPELLEWYDNDIKEQLSKGIIDKVDEKDLTTRRYYILPHHAVINPKKSTTKIRTVYDASAKKKNGMRSSNECLHRCPVILKVRHFRTKRIGITADIDKSFLQIALQEQDRDVTWILWIKDIKTEEINNNFETYRFKRFPFGITFNSFHLKKYYSTSSGGV